jgi:hypothetical protein
MPPVGFPNAGTRVYSKEFTTIAENEAPIVENLRVENVNLNQVTVKLDFIDRQMDD